MQYACRPEKMLSEKKKKNCKGNWKKEKEKERKKLLGYFLRKSSR